MRAQPKLLHTFLADMRPLPSKSGNTIKLRRYEKLSLATTPLTEGVPPNGQRLVKTDLNATVSQYGDFVHITDVVDLTVQDAVLTEATELLGEQEGETIDALVRDILVAGASTTTASNGSPTATLLNRTDIDTVVQTLLSNDCEMLNPVKAASTGVGSAPVRAGFWGIAHTDLIDDLEVVLGFLHTSKYPTQTGIHPAEWGSTGNVRWLVSSVAHDPANDSETYYNLPIIGRHAYAMTELEGSSETIIKSREQAGGPLNQSSTAGWKTMFTARILNDLWIHLLLVSNG